MKSIFSTLSFIGKNLDMTFMNTTATSQRKYTHFKSFGISIRIGCSRLGSRSLYGRSFGLINRRKAKSLNFQVCVFKAPSRISKNSNHSTKVSSSPHVFAISALRFEKCLLPFEPSAALPTNVHIRTSASDLCLV